MIINIGDELLRLRSLKLLKKLLVDKTTKKNIMWATDAYRALGAGYERNREMDEELITGMHADVIKTRARKAMESGTLTVLLWHQGEADCGKENSKLYHDRFSELVKRFRRDLGAPELPVIVGQLSKFPNKPWWDGKKQVDAAQRAVVEELPPAAFVPSDGLTSNPDIVHFDAASQREFGKRYFEAYQKLLEKENAKK